MADTPWLCVDPGETVGWSIWKDKDLVEGGQHPMWEFIDLVDQWLTESMVPLAMCEGLGPLGAIICEDWALYPWVELPEFDKCRTARAIGALNLLARQHVIPFVLQGAKIKEAAIAAGAEELFVSPRHENRHTNDSIMHGTYYLAVNGAPPC